MSEGKVDRIKEYHDYFEDHEFVIEYGKGADTAEFDEDELISVSVESRDDGEANLIFYAPYSQDTFSFSDPELSELVDLINRYLLWKKYSLTATVMPGDTLRVVTSAPFNEADVPF